MIEKYFDKYPGFVFSLNYTANIKTIHFWMPNTWETPTELFPENIGIQQNRQSVDKQDHSRHYSMVYMKDGLSNDTDMVTIKTPTYDELFEVLVAIFEYNLERERKQALLEQKMTELKTAMEQKMNDLKEKFTSLPLAELEKLDLV